MQKLLLILIVLVSVSGCLKKSSKSSSSGASDTEKTSETTTDSVNPEPPVEALPPEIVTGDNPVIPPPVTSNNSNKNSPLGTNLEGPEYYSAEWVFVDQMNKSRPWLPGKRSGNNCQIEWSAPSDWDASRNSKKPWLNENHWPQNLPVDSCLATLLMFDSQAPYPVGDYQIFWDGKGIVTINGNVFNSNGSGSGIHKVKNKYSADLTLIVVESSSSDPIRNIRVIVPGGICGESSEKLNLFKFCNKKNLCSTGETCYPFAKVYFDRFTDSLDKLNSKVVFHPKTLSRLSKYRALRFMDWMKTNNSKVKDWADRASIQYLTSASQRGVALEYMVALANVLGADAWFNLPHQSSDEYNKEFAAYVFKYLHPNLKAYVEYSNEAWNGLFSQAQYCEQNGRSLGLSKNNFEGQLRYYSKRSVEIFKIWSKIYSKSPERIVRTLAGQSGNVWTGQTIMDFEDAHLQADAYAIAPYFGNELGDKSDTPKMSLKKLMNYLKETSLAQSITQMKENVKETQKRNLPLIAYEGGQHLVGVGPAVDNEDLTKLFQKANRGKGMKKLYLDYLSAWKASGGELFMHFSHTGRSSKWGHWGSLNEQTQKSTPKFDALQTFITDNPCWWQGCSK